MAHVANKETSAFVISICKYFDCKNENRRETNKQQQTKPNNPVYLVNYFLLSLAFFFRSSGSKFLK